VRFKAKENQNNYFVKLAARFCRSEVINAGLRTSLAFTTFGFEVEHQFEATCGV